MFARFDRLEGPRDVKLIGERVVDRLDLGIPQEFIIRSIGLGDAERAGRGFGFVPVTRGDRQNLTPLSLLHGRYHLLNRNLGSAQNPPPHLVSHHGVSFPKRWILSRPPRHVPFISGPLKTHQASAEYRLLTFENSGQTLLGCLAG